MAMVKYYEIKAKSADKGEILLYSDIGDGGWFSEGTTASGFAQDLKALGAVKTIDCRINSPGGSVFEGLTIYNLLASHPAKVVMHIDGLAASIASVIAMAGDEINCADNGTMMIHNAYGVGRGTAEDMRKTAEVLDSLTGTIAKTYAKRSNVKLAKITELMTAETWMTAAEAKNYGLVDNVVDNMQVQACILDPKQFRNIPSDLLAAMAARPLRDRYTAKFQRMDVDRLRERRSASGK